MLNLKFSQPWTFWEKKVKTEFQSFQDLNKEMSTISDMRSFLLFWRDQNFNEIAKFLKNQNRDCVMMFREGIAPLWEHEKNKEGGHFQYFFNKINEKSLNTLWKKLVTLLVSENLKNFDKINGIRILLKEKDTYKLEIWVGNISQTEFYGVKENYYRTRK